MISTQNTIGEQKLRIKVINRFMAFPASLIKFEAVSLLLFLFLSFLFLVEANELLDSFEFEDAFSFYRTLSFSWSSS